MNESLEQELRAVPLRQIPQEWRTRILANARPPLRASPWFRFLWPHPAIWAGVAVIWIAVAAISFTGPRGKALYSFAPPGMTPPRVSPEAYAVYMAHCAAFQVRKFSPSFPLRRSEL